MLLGSHGRSFRIRHENLPEAPPSGEISMTSYLACNKTSFSRKPRIPHKKLYNRLAVTGPSLKPAARGHNTINSINSLSFLKRPSKSLPSQLYTTGGCYNPVVVVSPCSINCIRGCKKELVIVQHIKISRC